MNRKQPRKPLSDALAKEFVYGTGDKKVSPAVTSEPIATVEVSEPEPTLAPTPAPTLQPVSQPTQAPTLELTPALTIQPTPQSTSQQQPTFMDKLQSVPPKEATKRFTVDLAESTHRKLSMLAARTGRTKAEIVRLLLEDALKDVQE